MSSVLSLGSPISPTAPGDAASAGLPPPRTDGEPADAPGPSAQWLDRLNPAQRRAATFGNPLAGGGVEAPPLLIIAGAGTGKTATLAHRVAWLVLAAHWLRRTPVSEPY